MTAGYDALAEVYDYLVPDALLEPEGAAAAFEPFLDGVPPGGRVLDCAAGTGQLAVGLALHGYEVVATDISLGMVGRIRNLAQQRNVELQAEASSWEDLPRLDLPCFDAVLCVGSSLPHARGEHGRRAALTAMRSRLGQGGLLVVTSRNWERVRARGSRLEVWDRLVVRQGVAGVVVYRWTVRERWEQPLDVEVGVGLLRGQDVIPHLGTLQVWPFTSATLQADLAASGFAPELSTYAPEVERYVVRAHVR